MNQELLENINNHQSIIFRNFYEENGLDNLEKLSVDNVVCLNLLEKIGITEPNKDQINLAENIVDLYLQLTNQKPIYIDDFFSFMSGIPYERDHICLLAGR